MTTLAYGLGYLSGKAVNVAAEEWDDSKRQWRAISRVVGAGVCIAPLGFALWQIEHLARVDPARVLDQPKWLVVAGGAGAAFLFLLRYFGRGRGIALGAKLWLLSLGWLTGCGIGFAALGMTISQVQGDRDAPTWPVVIGFWAVALPLMHYSMEALKRSEAQQ